MLAFSIHKFTGLSALYGLFVPEQNNQINEAQNGQYVPNGVV